MRKYFLLNAKHDHSLVKIENSKDEANSSLIETSTPLEKTPPKNSSYSSMVCPHQPSEEKSECSTLCCKDSKLKLEENSEKVETELNFNYNQNEIKTTTKSQQLNQSLHRLISYIFFKESNKEYLDGLHNFLTRVTTSKTAMPENFMRLCNESRLIKETTRLNAIPPTFLCPYIKSFGKCKRN